jgi:hypothetical protein
MKPTGVNMHNTPIDLRDLKRPRRVEKVLDYLTAFGIGLALAVLLVMELSK